MAKLSALLIVLCLLPTVAPAQTTSFSVISGEKIVGHLIATTNGAETRVDYDVKNNGRGPTISETIRSNPDGLPVEWSIGGSTTFGGKVEERFSQSSDQAEWRDSTGKGSARIVAPGLYLAQTGSPWSEEIIARALLKAPGMTLKTLPGGSLHLTRGQTLTVNGAGGAVPVTRYDLSGIDLSPQILLLDPDGHLFAEPTPNSILIRKGYEGEDERLRKLAADWSTQRFVDMEKELAHQYAAPVRIKDVRIFDPKTSTLTGPVSVLVSGKIIAAVEPLTSPATPGEVTIEGGGGTLVAGLYEMHAHLQQDGALLNLIAGITTVRDMGNDNAVLDKLTARMESGEIGGPHVIRSGFIEGKSPYSANNGILVDNQQAALDAVRWYGARDYWQIKIYNSMNPAWVPEMVKEAHHLGMRVAGHVPAFATADEMIADGYDEMTHINQFMLGWVMTQGEDTRTLFRLTAMKRFPSIDLDGAKVRRTVQMMVDGKKSIDPTLGIHENLTLNRDGQVPPGAVDYIDHLPIGARRDMMKAWADTSAPGDDQLYRGAWDKIIATTKLLHDRGVFIVFGTDTGGSFTYHRELQIYQEKGIMTAPEILKRATYDCAKYTGQDQRMGSIEKGKLADFFLIPGDPTADIKAIKTIEMVVKDGRFYYPAEVYPRFGIDPFIAAPKVSLAADLR